MLRGEKLIEKIDENKPVIWGVFLSTQILGHAIGSISLAILSALFLLTVMVRKKIILKKYFFPLLVYFLWGVLSLLWTTYPPNTLSGIGSTIAFLLIPMVVSQQSNFTSGDLKKTVNIFSIALIIYFFVSLIKSFFLYLEDADINHFFYHDLVSIFRNSAIYISLFTGICILIKINLPNKTVFDKIIIVILSIFLLLLASKNLIISTVFLSVFSFVFFMRKRRSLKSGLIISSIVLLIAVCFMVFDNPVKQRFVDETTTNIEEVWQREDFSDFAYNGSNLRLFQWRVVSEMIENGQINMLGLGLNNINYLTDQYFHYYNLYEGYMLVNFHNQYLQTLGELGFIGLVILILTLFYLLYKAIKSKNKFLFLFTVLMLLCFLTESYFCRQKGVLFFSVFYSILLSYRQFKKA